MKCRENGEGVQKDDDSFLQSPYFGIYVEVL